MDILPIELKFRSLYDVPFPDILTIFQTASEYQSIGNDDKFWQLKAEHQLGVSPRRFNKPKKLARKRFIELYVNKYPIPGSENYISPSTCIKALIELVTQGYVEFQDYDLFELLQYYLSLDDKQHSLLDVTAYLAGSNGLITIIYYLLTEAQTKYTQAYKYIYHYSLMGASRCNQTDLLNILITKALDSAIPIGSISNSILVGAAESSNLTLLNWVWNNKDSLFSVHPAIIAAIKHRQSSCLNFFRYQGVNIKGRLDKILIENKLAPYCRQFIINYLTSINK